jgi:N,N-dimethylformamidase
MEIVGYTDRLSVAPGETVRFMVSTESDEYSANIVRLIHGNTDPAGPGLREVDVASSVTGMYRGRHQSLHPGSCALIPTTEKLACTDGVSLHAWIWPTTVNHGEQGLVTRWQDDDSAGYGLFITADGTLAWRVATADGVRELRSRVKLREFVWYSVAASYDAATGRLVLGQHALGPWRHALDALEHETATPAPIRDGGCPVVVAGNCVDSDGERIARHFNGKVDAPTVIAGGLTPSELAAILDAGGRDRVSADVVAAWDFSHDISSRTVTDVGGSGLHGSTVNTPMRAVTGHNFTGNFTNYTMAPREYGAIFFHDDDLDDAGWEVDFDFTIPDDLRSGVYAARLRSANGAVDHLPFFVRPKPGTTTARTCVLIPTYSYLAYANDHQTWKNPVIPTSQEILDRLQPEDDYAVEQRLMSLYDRHADDTGVALASRLRPMVNMRPSYRLAIIDSPHQLSSDLHLIDWLTAKGHEFDVVTDEDLHNEGAELLRPYQVVMTGSHPEYDTLEMLDAIRDYVDDGGRFMYLGGNGFYWVISVDPERPDIIELRRGERGTGLWRSATGEYHHQTTGEQGGIWRDRNRAPQALVGTGFAADGIGPGRPYTRMDGAANPRAAFVLEGVEEDEFGGFGLVLGGAGGSEVDRLDHRLGSPLHAVIVATTRGFTDQYHHVIEEVESSDDRQGGTMSPLVRGDMVFFETRKGGAVFSSSSISWCGSLSHNDYQNPISRIMENVLGRFLDPDPFPDPVEND